MCGKKRNPMNRCRNGKAATRRVAARLRGTLISASSVRMLKFGWARGQGSSPSACWQPILAAPSMQLVLGYQWDSWSERSSLWAFDCRRRNHWEQMRRMAPKLRQACNGAEMLSAGDTCPVNSGGVGWYWKPTAAAPEICPDHRLLFNTTPTRQGSPKLASNWQAIHFTFRLLFHCSSVLFLTDLKWQNTWTWTYPVLFDSLILTTEERVWHQSVGTQDGPVIAVVHHNNILGWQVQQIVSL